MNREEQRKALREKMKSLHAGGFKALERRVAKLEREVVRVWDRLADAPMPPATTKPSDPPRAKREGKRSS